MRITRSIGKKALVLAAASAGVTLTAAPSAFAATTGTATLVNGSNQPITTGSMSTPFQVSLSAPGVCSGTSSTSPQYFVFSFVVPPPASNSSLGAELGAINWNNSPYPSQAYPLIDNTGAEYGPSNTSTAGQPLPPNDNFSFGQLNNVLTSNSMTPLTGQSWEVGYACETGGSTVDYWSTLVSFDQNGNWSISSSVAAPEVPFAIVLPAAGAGLLGGGLLFARRRNKRQPLAA